ncbi:TPA: DUF421 domain-containing protein [Proteus mirabilis]|uniref:DUF421 domain-containing protein n=10 Tax=Proteus mirabilis TaxID=584 RepID=A0A1Z1SYE6_PROMI|nr:MULTISPECIES: YetF domain-containing protein [Proteus]ARA21197.1 DUF421 domain-containing protein [Proteus mirabilis]ARX35987.1 DUF421 domain-containing protein [Proteus mirabilis]ASB01291.1 DUF421 domain-containing protein [Proteus mirabilis]AUT92647.1 DUF421 domain-containing protein [Proteus mirabilis]AUU34467.1 DUF421 domain-containing protein [Proteus mirabilis]
MEYYLLVVIKFIIGFTIILAHMNISGKTQLSQLTPIDFIGNFVLGGIMGGVIYTDAIPLYQYVIVFLIGVFFISFLNYISKKFNFFRAVAIGNPIPIIKKGRFIMENITEKKNKIDILNITSRLHAQGIHSFQEVNYAQIEPDGQITVVCDGAKMPSIIIMKDGVIRTSELEQIERDENWLNEEMKKQHIDNPEDVFLAEFWDGKVNFILQDGKIKHDFIPTAE